MNLDAAWLGIWDTCICEIEVGVLPVFSFVAPPAEQAFGSPRSGSHLLVLSGRGDPADNRVKRHTQMINNRRSSGNVRQH